MSPARGKGRSLNEISSRQLAALADVVESFGGAGIQYLLFGGWAVDFHARRVTRGHDDIDVAVWLCDLARIATLLEADGWRHAPEPDEDGGTGYERESVRLELTYLARTADGAVCIPLRGGHAPWPAAALAPVTAELGNVQARVMPLDALGCGKARPREDPEDAAKDRADAAVLTAAKRGRPS